MEPTTLSDEVFERFQSLIYRHSGICLNGNKRRLLLGRLRRRLEATQIDTVEKYLRLVSRPSGNNELQHLLAAVTTNETSFFRTTDHFDWFSDTFLDQYVNHKRAENTKPVIRIWSAACASGAEAYTLAMCIHRRRFRLKDCTIEITASDLDQTSLDTAKKGRYKKRLLANAPEWVSTYFERGQDGDEEKTVKQEIRDSINFRHHNLLNPFEGGPFDLVFLRNVLIYFDTNSKLMVLNRISQAMLSGAYLVVGPSEGIFGLNHNLEKINTFLYRKPQQLAATKETES